LDQGQPPGRPVDHIGAADNGGPVAVDADDAGPGNGQDRAAIAAGLTGGVDIESALAGGKQRNRLAAEDGNMPGRTHARPTEAGGPREGKLQANRPIAPRIPAFSRPFRRKSRKTGAIADPARPKEETKGQTPVSAWNVLAAIGLRA